MSPTNRLNTSAKRREFLKDLITQEILSREASKWREQNPAAQRAFQHKVEQHGSFSITPRSL
jgi:hypothetical protein